MGVCKAMVPKLMEIPRGYEMKTVKTILAFIIAICWGLAPVLAGDSLGEQLVFLCYWFISMIVVIPIVFYLIKK